MQVVLIYPLASVLHSLMEISVWIVLTSLKNIAQKHVVFVEVCIRDANILPKADIISLIVFLLL